MMKSLENVETVHTDSFNWKIESNGSRGMRWANSTGGPSGGGSINVFYKKGFTSTGTITADGLDVGDLYSSGYNGGKGGNGTVSIGSVASGVYVSNQ